MTDCWQVILSFCSLPTLETIFIYGEKKIRRIFSNSHFLLQLLETQDILPELILYPVRSFIYVCQLIRLDQTTGTTGDLAEISDVTGTSAKLLAQLLCLNGRSSDAVEIVRANDLGNTSSISEITLLAKLMMKTQRGSIKNLVEYIQLCSRGSLVTGIVIDMLYFVLSRHDGHNDVIRLVVKNKEYLEKYISGREILTKWN